MENNLNGGFEFLVLMALAVIIHIEDMVRAYITRAQYKKGARDE